ncbi:MAG: hypothetical protein AAGF24_03045 [Cyanobacteria bacterium P01_H01_bin.121]
MATVIFYEKPGCINNTKQKQLLQAAGHRVEAHSLLSEPWTQARLVEFFGTKPVSEWFNRSAPMVKSGDIDPIKLDATTALALMLENPLLIRRPLMQIEAIDARQADQGTPHYIVGFDQAEVQQWISLEPQANRPQTGVARQFLAQDLQTCPRS